MADGDISRREARFDGILQNLRFLNVDYAPVKFQSQNAEVWLPQSAVVYTEYFRRRTVIWHTFSDFQRQSDGMRRPVSSGMRYAPNDRRARSAREKETSYEED
jgi:hypothetical protein